MWQCLKRSLAAPFEAAAVRAPARCVHISQERRSRRDTGAAPLSSPRSPNKREDHRWSSTHTHTHSHSVTASHTDTRTPPSYTHTHTAVVQPVYAGRTNGPNIHGLNRLSDDHPRSPGAVNRPHTQNQAPHRTAPPRTEDERQRCGHRIGFLPLRPLFRGVRSGLGDGPGAGRWSRYTKENTLREINTHYTSRCVFETVIRVIFPHSHACVSVSGGDIRFNGSMF